MALQRERERERERGGGGGGREREATLQAPGIIGSALGLVGLVSVYCDGF